MKLNIFKRSMIFSTFFGSCLCVALIIGSLGTSHWVDAKCICLSSYPSEGRINFGLFGGHMELPSEYGDIEYSDISVKAGNHPARRWAWCGCAGVLGAALLCAGGGAALAAVGSASRTTCGPRPLLIINSLAVLFTLGAIAIWVTEFYLRLQHNVFSSQYVQMYWYSDGMAELGQSFWLVVAACLTAVANIVCVFVAARVGREADSVAPALEEKVNGAIMLY